MTLGVERIEGKPVIVTPISFSRGTIEMKITLSNNLVLHDPPPPLARALQDKLCFVNPKWTDNDRMGRWQGATQPTIQAYSWDEDTMIIPRGYARQLLATCRRMEIPYQLEDRRRILPEVSFSFVAQLRGFQKEAVNAVLSRDFGVLSSPTGSGKTVMALAIVAIRRQPTLVITHTKELANQWISRAQTFLGIPEGEVGVIGDGKRTIGNRLTISLVQSLYRCASEVSPFIGHLIVDECHRAPSRTFTEGIRAFNSNFMLGLSATAFRRDGLSRLIYWSLGDLSHEVAKAPLIESGDILPATVTWRRTNFRPISDPTSEYPAMLSELTQDSGRNLLIAHDVSLEARDRRGGVILVLSDRKAHCEALCALLGRLGVRAEMLTGDLSDIERRRVVRDLKEGKVRVLIATNALLGEGFDCPSLSTLFLGTPISFDGRLIQSLGRILRPSPGKAVAKVYDYVDPVGVLEASARSRARVYEKAAGCTASMAQNASR
jgi:superfamily II DNA or RNA helicase